MEPLARDQDAHPSGLDRLFETMADPRWLAELTEQARREDLGAGGDITSRSFLTGDQEATAAIVAREPGLFCGGPLVAAICGAYDEGIGVEVAARDGDRIDAGQVLGTCRGRLASILAAERVVLNFLTFLSGIATLTRRYVDAVAGTGARIYDTRKTIPGYRVLSKYAVVCGGGSCHRVGLYDAVLVKDNHIASVRGDELARVLREGIAKARATDPPPGFVEVEVDTLDQLATVLTVEGVDVVLLDNMPPGDLARAVAMRDERGVAVGLEASGGVDLDTVRAIAETGVDRIAIGALTHSAPALDIGLDVRGA